MPEKPTLSPRAATRHPTRPATAPYIPNGQSGAYIPEGEKWWCVFCLPSRPRARTGVRPWSPEIRFMNPASCRPAAESPAAQLLNCFSGIPIPELWFMLSWRRRLEGSGSEGGESTGVDSTP